MSAFKRDSTFNELNVPGVLVLIKATLVCLKKERSVETRPNVGG